MVLLILLVVRRVNKIQLKGKLWGDKSINFGAVLNGDKKMRIYT